MTRLKELHGIRQMDDIKDLDTGLSDDERRDAVYESKRLRSLRGLGNKWLHSRRYNGHYVPELTRKAA
jgi:hypothetical protein